MRENFSSSAPDIKDVLASADNFVAQLRNVTMKGNTRPVSMGNEKKSSIFQASASQPTEESHYSRDFLKYRSQIQRELSRGVSGVSKSEMTLPSQSSTEQWKPTVSAVSTVSTLQTERKNQNCLEHRVSSRNEYSLESRPDSQVGNPLPIYKKGNPYVSNSAMPSVLSTSQQAQVARKPEIKKESNPQSQNELVQDQKSEFVSTGNNPFTKLVNTQQKKTMEKSGILNDSHNSANSNTLPYFRSGWLWNLRCFGTLGMVTGISMATFSTFSEAGTHQLTAMGLSLCISGFAMFATLGLCQALRSEITR